MKNSLEGLKSRFEQSEERINELENKTIEIIQSEEPKEKKVIKKSEQILRDLWDTISWTNTYVMGLPEGKEKENI